MKLSSPQLTGGSLTKSWGTFKSWNGKVRIDSNRGYEALLRTFFCKNVDGLVFFLKICPSLLLLNGHCAFNYIICQKPFKSNPKEPRYPEKRGLPNFGICAGSIEILWCNLFNLSQLIKTFEMALLGLPSALEPLCAPLNFFLENSHKLDQVINTDYSFILLINLLISWVTEWLRCKCFTITIILSWALFFANCLQIVVMCNFLNLPQQYS